MRLAATKTLYLITDRRLLGEGAGAIDRVVALAGDASDAGVDLIQIRERDLSSRDLVELARRVRDRVAAHPTKVLVNDRFDVALAAGAHGVHLATHSIEAPRVRAVVGDRLLVGASTHSLDELQAAERGGADFAVCGPVFETPSKHAFGKPIGPSRVAELASHVQLPVLALGGITRANAADAARPSVAGIAAIGMFHSAWLTRGAEGLRALVADLRRSI